MNLYFLPGYLTVGVHYKIHPWIKGDYAREKQLGRRRDRQVCSTWIRAQALSSTHVPKMVTVISGAAWPILLTLYPSYYYQRKEVQGPSARFKKSLHDQKCLPPIFFHSLPIPTITDKMEIANSYFNSKWTFKEAGPSRIYGKPCNRREVGSITYIHYHRSILIQFLTLLVTII